MEVGGTSADHEIDVYAEVYAHIVEAMRATTILTYDQRSRAHYTTLKICTILDEGYYSSGNMRQVNDIVMGVVASQYETKFPGYTVAIMDATEMTVDAILGVYKKKLERSAEPPLGSIFEVLKATKEKK